jgi:hypothetical protein
MIKVAPGSIVIREICRYELPQLFKRFEGFDYSPLPFIAHCLLLTMLDELLPLLV